MCVCMFVWIGTHVFIMDTLFMSVGWRCVCAYDRWLVDVGQW